MALLSLVFTRLILRFILNLVWQQLENKIEKCFHMTHPALTSQRNSCSPVSFFHQYHKHRCCLHELRTSSAPWQNFQSLRCKRFHGHQALSIRRLEFSGIRWTSNIPAISYTFWQMGKVLPKGQPLIDHPLVSIVKIASFYPTLFLSRRYNSCPELSSPINVYTSFGKSKYARVMTSVYHGCLLGSSLYSTVSNYLRAHFGPLLVR